MNFLDKNTNVEWGRSKLTKGDKTLNLLMTSHELKRVFNSTQRLYEYLYSGYTLCEDDHIHPEIFNNQYSPDDLNRKNSLLFNSPSAVFRIYNNGKFTIY